jgi:hypothetical protein
MGGDKSILWLVIWGQTVSESRKGQRVKFIILAEKKLSLFIIQRKKSGRLTEFSMSPPLPG